MVESKIDGSMMSENQDKNLDWFGTENNDKK